MIKANIHEAKTNLSKYLSLIQKGEEVIICNNKIPVAVLKPYVKEHDKRILGIWKDKVKISQDFDNLPNNFMKFFK